MPRIVKIAVYSGILLLLTYLMAGGPTHNQAADRNMPAQPKEATAMEKIIKTDAEWRKLLTPEQYRITRQKGTEPAFSDKYRDFKGKGVYLCVACGLDLFGLDTKFDSGTGWPSFWMPVAPAHISTVDDSSFMMKRTEVLCARCGAHLGHVFHDGPPPTGLRYCINSAALTFKGEKEATAEK